MMSLWSLLNPREPLRYYALLDAQGSCRALREARQQPAESGWVEVQELRSSWLGQPLPSSARIAPARTKAHTAQALAA